MVSEKQSKMDNIRGFSNHFTLESNECPTHPKHPGCFIPRDLPISATGFNTDVR